MDALELDTLDKLILKELQGDLDDSPEPYARIAANVNASEDDVIRRIRRMRDEGVIRRIGAMIRHIEAGITFNGMVVWKVDEDRVEDVGQRLADFPEVTHCYERPAFGRHHGTIFTMVHAESEEGCLEIVDRIARTVGVSQYEILFSKRELKKVSMTYFGDENDDEA